MLTTGVNGQSAQIYQFPAGGRAALGGRRYGEAKAAVSEFAVPAVNLADSSGSWYHAAAIQETKPGRDH
jgi:Protein of unknown function (DUF2735)